MNSLDIHHSRKDIDDGDIDHDRDRRIVGQGRGENTRIQENDPPVKGKLSGHHCLLGKGYRNEAPQEGVLPVFLSRFHIIHLDLFQVKIW